MPRRAILYLILPFLNFKDKSTVRTNIQIVILKNLILHGIIFEIFFFNHSQVSQNNKMIEGGVDKTKQAM